MDCELCPDFAGTIMREGVRQLLLSSCHSYPLPQEGGHQNYCHLAVVIKKIWAYSIYAYKIYI